MRQVSVRTGILLAGTLALLSCVPRAAPPEPQAVPEPVRPEPAPPPPPPRPAPGWQDAPLTPGGWSYRGEGATSTATFGPAGRPLFAVRCERSRQLSLARIGVEAGNAMIVRTSYNDRSLAAAPQQGALVASVAAADPLLDAMVFSRGRFAVDVAGAERLVIPAWPAAARVVEDCRG